ncbi:hypothetical protein B1222_06695 [Paenibacillus larvae subsp. pulvifaciens]|uniref:hypothetical protein n=1 Tax=Paenibacillus larvae TaxID=1464 RepID=UPI00098EDBA0|nr:hypothetical protein [Paenibacillus larvae]AQT84145.1 hypothetical protein B1222_06695 [Paenibacillus larvae subsp. pulvifaciens]
MECSVRVGKVSSVNTQKHAVRVAFSDVAAVSSELPVLRFANGWAKDNSLPSVGIVLFVFLWAVELVLGTAWVPFTAVVIVYRVVSASSGSILMTGIASAMTAIQKPSRSMEIWRFPVKSSKVIRHDRCAW